MCISNDEVDPHEEAWPFDAVLEAGRVGARAQRQRFHDYIKENKPALAAALAAEAARFDVLSRTVIEPTMHECAREATQCGWHISIIRDDSLDRLTLLGTPSIRFYGSRSPIFAPVSDVISPTCFVAYYGCMQILAVRICVELVNDDGEAKPSSETLEYAQVTVESVRRTLDAFLRDLEGIG